MQINLRNSGTWIYTSDHCIVQENYDSVSPQGWFSRDHHAWLRSNQLLHSLQELTDAKMIFGHDREVMSQYKIAPEFYD
jgi:hypothetical protein